MNIKIIFVLVISLCYNFLTAQKFEVKIEPVQIHNMGGIQSFAIGVHEGEWVILGGRLDGLHQRQPFASFRPDGNNEMIYVVNPQSKLVWKTSINSLSITLREQLSSTNMQFYQDKNELICTGGYGYSRSNDDHVTYPYLTVIDLPIVINSIKQNKLNPKAFTQIENEAFRVTGGALNKIGDNYYLVGGHKFMGRYNPMGPQHGPGFIQEYTNEIRKFKLINGGGVSVEFIDIIYDENHLHRRDYNLIPFLSNGERKLMIFSGVFQSDADFPWLYPVSISSNNYEPKEEFTQYYNHYHCAHLPIYDSQKETMHTIFFGGIAQFYEKNGYLVQDNDIPFVKSIAEVTHDKNGIMTETIMADTMPGYLGAGSVFIINEDIPLVDNDIIDANVIGSEFQDIGHIYGGIRSSMPNIFWTNTGIESSASNTIYKVSIRQKKNSSPTHDFSKEGNLQFYPIPAQSQVMMEVSLDKPTEIEVSITDSMGQKIDHRMIKSHQTITGRNIILLDKVNVGYGSYFYTVRIGEKLLTRKVIWTE